LGEYTQTGLPSFVVREIASEDGSGRWRSVFLGEPLINEKLIRGLCSLAGVHVWSYHGDVVHARPPFLSIHYSGTGHRIATLPDRWHAYDPLHKELIGEDATHLRSDATDGASQVLYVGEEADVMRLSAAQSTDALDISLFTEVEFESESQEIAELDVPLIDVEAEEEPEPEVVEKRKSAKRERKPKPAAKKPVKKTEKAKPEPGGIGFSFRPKNEK
jgi:outer membrane biosynthesis protein TonB